MHEVLNYEVKCPIRIFLTKLFYPEYRKVYWRKNRPLTWEDFVSNPDDSSPHDASICWKISFSLNVSFKGWKINVQPLFECYIDRFESWIRSTQESDHLLQHEQLHLDIAELFTRRMRKKCSRIKSSVFRRWIKCEKVYYSFLNECTEMQVKYDMETNHSENKKEQVKWAKYLKKELKRHEKFI
jgi:hypothetical protein